MMQDSFQYTIRADLPAHTESPVSLSAKFLDTLDALSQVDASIFDDWQVIDLPALETFPLADVRPRIAEIIGNNVKRDDDEEPDPRLGYAALAFNGDDRGARGIGFEVTAGGIVDGSAFLRTGGYKVSPDPAMLTYPLFRSALLAVNAFWSPAWACAHVFKMHYDKAPLSAGAPLFPYSRFHIPWIAYLSAPLALGLRLPDEIRTERTPDGGLLMTATEERLDPTNSEHLRSARIVAEAMIARAGGG
jgi:immunity protein 52 of polymorphic toxin system